MGGPAAHLTRALIRPSVSILPIIMLPCTGGASWWAAPREEARGHWRIWSQAGGIKAFSTAVHARRSPPAWRSGSKTTPPIKGGKDATTARSTGSLFATISKCRQATE
jgi:hypothetical protein